MPRRFKLCQRKDRARREREARLQASARDVAADASMTPVITSDEQVIEQTTDVLALHQSLASCSNGWVDITTEPVNVIHMCKFSDVSTPSTQRPPVITHSLSVNANLTWTLHIHGHPVSPQSCTVLQSVPGTLTSESLHALLQLVDDSKVCCGQPDSHFVSMVKGKKGKIISVGGQVKAYIDEHAPTTLGDDCYQATIRMTSCELLTRGTKCSKCKSYRGTLRAMHNRWVKRNACDMSSPTSHSNERYLNTPQRKQKMSKLKKRLVMAERQVNKLAAKIEEFTQTQGTSVDPGLHSGLLSVMNDSTETVNKTFAEGTFARLFWEQQLKVASVKDCRQARWHPLMIKFCLNIKLMSSAAYHALRTSGFIRLPSERTLRDYTHFFKSSPGIHSDLNEQLKKEAAIESLPESQRYVALLIDEMKIKEDLVYDKYSGHIIGFTSLGDLNDIMSCLEQGCEEEVLHPSLSKYILVLMVRGIFFRLEFPYAHFGTEGATGDFLFPIIWDAIRQLECIGLKVICVTGDGASPNRKFFRMHGEKGAITYKTHNPFADPKENRPLFFVSDPPHLVKTTRNCWSHSGYNGTRLMSVNGKTIEWKHLQDLHDKLMSMAVRSCGLSFVSKLKMEHVKLTSFSRMRVDLAAQVLSKSVADALAQFGDQATSETEKFIRNFDRLFDCLNGRSLSEWRAKNKPDLKPYTSVDDTRLKWLKDEFLGYLDSWASNSLITQPTLEPDERQKMMLSAETVEGLHITVNSFVEMANFLLKDNKLFLLSERISQDPLENYFGRQRARGGRNENPNLQQCMVNAAALRIQKSVALDPVRGNCRRKRRAELDEATVISESVPLPKRRKPRGKKE